MQVAAMLLAATSNMLSHLGEYACHQAVNHGFNRAMDQDMVELFGRLVVPVVSTFVVADFAQHDTYQR